MPRGVRKNQLEKLKEAYQQNLKRLNEAEKQYLAAQQVCDELQKEIENEQLRLRLEELKEAGITDADLAEFIASRRPKAKPATGKKATKKPRAKRKAPAKRKPPAKAAPATQQQAPSPEPQQEAPPASETTGAEGA